MFDLAFLLAPTFATFLLGFLFRRLRILDDADVDTLFKVIFNLALPALLLSVLPFVSLERSMLALPAASLAVIILTGGAAAISGRFLRLPDRSLGVLYSGAIIMNLGFIMPFVKSFYGDEGLARLFVFDLPNSISAYTLAYALACRSGEGGLWGAIRKVLSSPPVWALGAGITMNLLEVRPGPIEAGILQSLASLAIPLLLLSLGASARFAAVPPARVLTGIGVRMALGLGAGILLAALFRLEGIDRAIVIIAASAPAGFNTLTFASLENLDRNLAATLVTTGMLISLVLVPLLVAML
ncbi:AEC family transporter [Chlorobium sp. N1]|uniref:AEC family transporter n=1 Tax=Chlorobium sp. N1 TaxID=2491138 RepID=UPI00104028CD|nr:AEC family transporter [Chlorobium sp. N1]TCD47096.1 AEC family transporter [Chlorobium sp. N1]